VSELNLAELKELYVVESKPLPASVEAALQADPRRGAKAILNAVEKRRRANRAEGQRLRRLFKFEQELWERGVEHIAGVDEAGMSPLAGPVVAAAVVLPRDFRIARVDDSKKLSAEVRTELAATIKENALAWAVGLVEPAEIDRINIYHAGLLAMRRAIEGRALRPAHLLIDARRLKDVPIEQTPIVRGDALSFSIAAASIIAKTTRDARMLELDALYPGYGLAQHKGYPVAQHVRALETLGVSEIHRRSFGPVRKAMGLVPEQLDLLGSDQAG
jgi:ribonuclease HII